MNKAFPGNDLDLWEIDLLQRIDMFVVGDQEIGVSADGTVHEYFFGEG